MKRLLLTGLFLAVLLIGISMASANNWCNGADLNRDGKVNISCPVLQVNVGEKILNVPDCSNLNLVGDEYRIWKENYNPLGNPPCTSPSWCNNADINKDGKVDGGDLAILQQEDGKTNCIAPSCKTGDINGDGKVDGGDLAIIQQEWNSSGNYCGRADLNSDGKVDNSDINIFNQNYDAIGIGTCILAELTCPEIQTCTDSDGGKNYYEKGETCFGETCKKDFCSTDNENYLVEYYCQKEDDMGSDWYNCSNGCKDGACNSEQICERYEVRPTRFLTENGVDNVALEYKEEGAWYILKDRMIVGDVAYLGNVQIKIVSINRIEKTAELSTPNSLFEKVYGDAERTVNDDYLSIDMDNDDYFTISYNCSKIIVECPSYTCEGGFKPKCEIINNQCSCESCPAIPIKPNESTGPINIPDVENSIKISYDCNGCELGKKCYPFGYRKSGEYCSDDSSFIKQKQGQESCENNFECSSNVCVAGKCVSESLIQKIINWFKRLFGIE